MNKALCFSMLLNLGLLGGLICILTNRQREMTASVPVAPEVKTRGQALAAPIIPPPAGPQMESFHWSQLMSGNNYRLYIARLRGIGCPEATIEEIAQGDTERAFAWERSQLALDDSSTGPWSRQAAEQLVASLLEQPGSADAVRDVESPKFQNQGETTAPISISSQSASSETADYPLVLQNVNWNALGFSSGEQAIMAEVKQQHLNQVQQANWSPGAAANQRPGTVDPNSNPVENHGSPADASPEDQLLALLGAQGYAAYEQQKYYAWYQPQVLADAEGGNLIINPRASAAK